jgi:hypothetical protein
LLRNEGHTRVTETRRLSRCYEGGGKETYIVLAGKPLEKRPLGSLRRQNEKSEMDARELGSEDWLTELVLGRVR